jgi:hypothetical protein
MSSTVKHLRSSTADKRPTASGLADGQLGINTASGTPGIFFKDSAGTVVKVGPAHVGSTAPNVVPAGSAGNSRGELWVNNSTTINGLNYYTGSAFVNLTPSGTLTTAGLVELATAAETQAGTDSVRAITPSGLQSKISDSTSTASSTTIASSAAVKQAYDLAAAAVAASGTSIITGELLISSTGSLVFEGSVDDSFETTLAVVNPTADRTITLPNITGTVITTGDTNTVTGTMIASGTITNTEISASAAIGLSKLATGALPSGITVNSANIVDGSIVNADINSSAAIAYSKLALSSGIVNTDINATAAIALSKLATGALPTGITVSSGNIVDGTITNADVSASAAIAGTKISPNFGSQNILTTGTATAASLIPTGSGVPTNGIYLPAANSVAISTNGSNRLHIASDGKIGVGIVPTVGKVETRVGSFTANLAADGYFLTSVNSTLAAGGGVIGGLTMESDGSGTYSVSLVSANSTTAGAQTYQKAVEVVASATSQRLQFYSGGSEKMRLDSAGRLGLGTSSPSELLTVRTTDNGTAALFQGVLGDNLRGLKIALGAKDTIDNSVVYINAQQGSKGTLEFQTISQTRLAINELGRVGIGTTSPGHALHVSNGNDSASGEFVGITIGGTNSANARTGSIIKDTTTFDLIYKNQNFSSALGSHVFRNGPSEHARIDSSGRLLVGTSTAVATNAISNAITPYSQIVGAGIAFSSFLNACYSNTVTVSAVNQLAKSRGALGLHTVVQAGDRIGAYSFAGSDGTAFIEAARIEAAVDGTPGANDMPGRLVFSTTADGASSPTEGLRLTNDNVIAYNQPAPTSKSAAATLTIAELKTGIIQYTGSAATLTLPTGTLSEGGFSGIYTNMTFEWSVINTGSGTCTIGAGTAHTIVGGATIAAGASGRFASRRTASNTFVSYRLA